MAGGMSGALPPGLTKPPAEWTDEALNGDYYRRARERVFREAQPVPPARPVRPEQPVRPEPADGPRGQVASRGTRRGPRHCWVVDAPEVPGRWPGVLLGWERDARGWLGRVVMAVEGHEGMVTMTLWVRAEHLRPLG